jgi:acetyl esterase/lipase
LCGCTGTLWNQPCLAEYLQEERELYRPDKLILCYPVLKNTGRHHQGSFDNLLGGADELQTAEMLELTSLEKHVGEHVPPCFLWHTFEDTGVPIDGTLEFAERLLEIGKPMEIHIFPHGGHGACLANYVTSDMPTDKVHAMAEWIDKAIRFVLDESILPQKEEA